MNRELRVGLTWRQHIFSSASETSPPPFSTPLPSPLEASRDPKRAAIERCPESLRLSKSAQFVLLIFAITAVRSAKRFDWHGSGFGASFCCSARSVLLFRNVCCFLFLLSFLSFLYCSWTWMLCSLIRLDCMFLVALRPTCILSNIFCVTEHTLVQVSRLLLLFLCIPFLSRYLCLSHCLRGFFLFFVHLNRS